MYLQKHLYVTIGEIIKKVADEGTIFVGQKDGDNLIIRDSFKEKRTLTYIGDAVFRKYYFNNDSDYIRFFYITCDLVNKYDKDGNTLLGRYDFRLSEFAEFGIFDETFCNYQ